jgi:MSHA biogenesis protein MshP
MRRRQQGFALVAAIILVVVLAGLSAFVASMVSGQGANQQLERMSRVADLAARAGLEWGAYRVMRPAVPPACPAVTTLTLPGLLSMTPVSVTCVRATTPEGAGTVSIYQITATAAFGMNNNNPDYVERTKTAVFSR